jgi:hypothetical protein
MRGLVGSLVAMAATMGNVPVCAQEVHEHGVSFLNVALEDRMVEIELESPAADIVGFERYPETPEERRAIEHAAGMLRDGAGLFVLPPAAKCVLTEAEVESPLLDGAMETEATGHTEFYVHYQFQCANPAAVSHMDVRLAQRFPAMREIEIQAISARGQTGRTLARGQQRFKF